VVPLVVFHVKRGDGWQEDVRIKGASGTELILDFKYKPEGMDQTSAPSGSKGASSNAATAQHQMSIDEAHLILNVKKEDPMEVIQKVR